MVDVSTISIGVASAGVFVASLYYIQQLRHQTRTRETDLLIRLFIAASNKEFVESEKKVMSPELKTYEDYLTHCPNEAYQVVRFYEGIGVLLHRRLIDIDLIVDLFTADDVWEKMQPAIEELRRWRNDPKLSEWFEYLYNEMKKRQQRGVKIG
jgi:hypothetical protein